jgi:hypothetical protein
MDISLAVPLHIPPINSTHDEMQIESTCRFIYLNEPSASMLFQPPTLRLSATTLAVRLQTASHNRIQTLLTVSYPQSAGTNLESSGHIS